MRQLIGIAITIILLANVEARQQTSPFASNQQYKYDYYGHFLASAPDVANQYIGMGIQGKVTIQAVSHETVIFKMDQVQTASLNQRLRHVDEDVIPWNFQESATPLTTHLHRPLRVHYANGQIKSVDASSDEPTESLNLKFGILSLFQVNLQDASESSSSSSSSKRNSLSPNNDEVTSYQTMEDSIQGECETFYAVQSNPSAENPNRNVLNVTKSTNYKNCNRRAEWARSTHLPNECSDCQADNPNPLETATVVEYDIEDNGRELVIESIEAEGKTIFAPFSSESDTLEANHTVTLKLRKVSPASQNAPTPLNAKTHTSLEYQFPTSKRALQQGPQSLKRPMVQFLSDDKANNNALPAAKQFLEQVVTKMVNEATHDQGPEDILLDVYELIQQVRKLSYDEVAQLYADTVKRDSSSSSSFSSASASKNDRMQVFVDASIMSGNPPAILHTKYLIESQQLKGEQAAQAVQAIATNLFEPTYEIVSEIENLAKSRVAREDSQLYKTSWLTFAILVNQACDGPEDDNPTMPEAPHVKTYCPQDVERKYIQELNQRLRSAPNKEETLLFLRCLGLTQTQTAIPYLKDFAEGRYNSDDSVRSAALRALRNIGQVEPDEVMDVAETVFYDTDNSDSVRISALRAMMDSQPDFSDMQRLAAWSDNEPSDDISGYIFSVYDSMANSSHPCEKEISNNAQQLLSLLDEEDENGIQGSNVFESSQYFEEQGASTQTLVSWTSSNSSIIPETINGHINNTIGGQSYQPIKFSIQTKGLQTLIDNTIGPIAAFKKINSIADIVKPEAEEQDRQNTNINSKLNLDTRTEDAFFVNAEVKIMGTQARSFHVNHKTIVKYLQSAGISKLKDLESGFPIHYHKLSLVHEIRYQTPSMLGVPIVLTIASPSIISVRGHVSASVDTTASHSGSLLPGNLRVQADIRASVASRLGARLGVYNPFDKVVSSAAVETSCYAAVPINIDANLNPLAGKFSMNLKPSSAASSSSSGRPIKLFHHKVHPYTCHYPLNNPNEYCQKPKTIHATSDPDLVEIDLSKEKVGLPLLFKSKSEHDWNDLGTFLDDIDDFEDAVSFANMWWTVPEFAPRQYELFLDSQSSASKEIELSAEFKYTPTPTEQLVLQNKRQLKGFWTVLSGFAKLPDQCEDNDNDDNNRDDNDDDDDDNGNNDDDDSQAQISRNQRSSSQSSKRFNQNRDQANNDDDNDNDDDDNDNDDDDQSSNSRRGFPYSSSLPYSSRPYSSLPYSSSLRSGASSSGSSSGSSGVSIQKLNRKNEVSAIEIRLKAAAKGSSAAKFLSTFSLKRDDTKNTDVVSLVIDMINIPALSSSQVQVCATGTAKYPQLPCNDEDLLDSKNQQEPITANMQVSWGSQCSSTPQISIKAKVEKSEEQKENENKQEEWYFQQCKEDREQGKKLTDACDEAINKLTNLNKITVTAEYSKLPSWMQNATSKLDTYLKASFYKQMSNNPVNVNNGEGRVKVVVRFHDDVPAADVLIFKPKENTFFNKVYYDDDLPYVSPISTQSSFAEDLIDDLTDGYESPSCEVMGKHINTFDNFTYKFPLTNCHHVMVKDCSPNDLHAVTMASAGNKKKILHVHLLNHKIAIKSQESRDGEFDVNIDGQSVQVSNDDEVIAVKSHNSEAEGNIIALIVTTGDSINVQAPHHGLQVEFDGEDAQITVSNLWRGKVCGLCGEFREEPENTFTDPGQCEVPNENAFGLSYGLPGPQCQLPKPHNPNKKCDNDNDDNGNNDNDDDDNDNRQRNNNDDDDDDNNDQRRRNQNDDDDDDDDDDNNDQRRRNQNDDDDDDDDDDNNDQRRRISNDDDNDDDDDDSSSLSRSSFRGSSSDISKRNKMIYKQGKVCFSVNPQPECQSRNQERNSKDKTVGFHCLPPNDPKADELKKASAHRVLNELSNKKVDAYETISVPQSCQK